MLLVREFGFGTKGDKLLYGNGGVLIVQRGGGHMQGDRCADRVAGM